MFLVGRDTRLSGPMVQSALVAGMTAEGADVVDLGVVPTPAVAAIAAARGLPAASVSASHNPFQDNGVKLFSSGGRKLSVAEEAQIEALSSSGDLRPGGVSGEEVGRLSSDPGALDWYCARVVGVLGDRRLTGLRVAVDCANGAASEAAPRILEAAGASIVAVLAASPDGTNINAGCGSTDPSRLRQAVRSSRADAGLALDGDADRVIAVDGRGGIVDGDRLLALFAKDMSERGLLAGQTVVATVMSNLGLRRALAGSGISLHETPVGDRHILEALEANGWSLGGEQSGHIIFGDLATTGDGMLTGLLLLDLLVRSGRPLAELAAEAMVPLPQVVRNVAVSDPRCAGQVVVSERVRRALAEVEERLGPQARVLLRPSGTEPLVRVMVEARGEAEALAAVEELCRAVEEASLPVGEEARRGGGEPWLGLQGAGEETGRSC